jgi:zinc/manganese transport system substrate-binding protein
VAEGNDPPTASVAEFQQQLQSGQVKVLVYNTQTVTPLTESIKKLATSEHIPIVGISETIEPPTDSFQTWMNAELTTLQTALAQGVRP